ncbi:VPS53 [Cordylochernes scorpioides]|uniref:Vacuolar protein sorting-associated protein 53 homolog n=1 Tax=Cordylochernes scorpioides TaxID=51811 RepID=A0ABY6L034_9ARAC|nr:VPS53 [Cordylochernes scorpioides]
MANTTTLDFDDDIIEDENFNSTITFAPEVQKSIEEVLSTTDPLDAPDFNAIDYINSLFPTEQSLSSIDEVMARMRGKIRHLDEDIRGVIRGQTATGQDGQVALDEAHRTIELLFIRIRDIKARAEKSEQMVKEITRDIKQLDHAKRHLTTSITTLNHLHMLVEGVASLQSLIRRRQYGDVASLLQGVVNVLDHFKSYQSIPQLRRLADQVHTIKTEVAQQITADFHNSFAGPNAKNFTPNQQLAEACLVISILDPKVKRDLLKWFVALQLVEYTHLFQESQDIAWLDKIDRRYAWLKKHLVEFDEKFGRMFPPDWELSERIAIEFCHVTRRELAKLLKARLQEIDVRLLLFSIQRTVTFEMQLGHRFSGSTLETRALPQPTTNTPSSPPATPPAASNPFEDGSTDDANNPFAEDAAAETQANFEKEDGRKASKTASATSPALQNPFQGIISSCFEPHLNIYVESQDKHLAQMLEKFASEVQKSRGVSAVTVLPSCGDLFVFYKKCLVQCTQLSTGRPMLALASTFQKYLREYATRVLQGSLPRQGSSLLVSNPASLISSLLKEGEVGGSSFSPAEQAHVCTVLSTAEYCLETTQQLEEKLREKVDPGLSGMVDFGPEQDLFFNVISHCIQLLVADLEAGCEPGLGAMTRLQWGAVEAVGDQSAYVTALAAHLQHNLPQLREHLAQSRRYFTQLCLKFANSFIPRFVAQLFKCRPLSPVGAEQLLLDTHMLKTVLLELPTLGADVARKPPASYIKIVVKGMTKAEMLLKVVMAPHSPPENFVDNFIKAPAGVGSDGVPESPGYEDYANLGRIFLRGRIDLKKVIELKGGTAPFKIHLPILSMQSIIQTLILNMPQHQLWNYRYLSQIKNECSEKRS